MIPIEIGNVSTVAPRAISMSESTGTERPPATYMAKNTSAWLAGRIEAGVVVAHVF